MQIGSEQGTFMTLLARIARPQRGGGRHVHRLLRHLPGRGLADGGRLLCCDVSDEWTSVARRFWQKAGVADRIELRLGPAIETLRSLPAVPALDLAFIDADKQGYVGYWEEIVPRATPGGIILVDNTFYGGEVAEPANGDAAVEAIRAFNDHAAADDRVELVMLAVGDGLTLARKK